jgi:hypothetical protein
MVYILKLVLIILKQIINHRRYIIKLYMNYISQYSYLEFVWYLFACLGEE